VWLLFFGEMGDASQLARAFGDLQDFERGLGAGLGLRPAHIAGQMNEPAGALDLDRFARRVNRQCQPGNRSASDRLP